jgi:GSH-dependent disulfide-bond oxidoreductase
MSETLILHGMNSPNVTKVVLMLEECALDYELRHVAVFKQEQFTPEFLALNPLGKVPVLEDPRLGIPLAESGAILHWLAEREGKFLPSSQPQSQAARAEVMQWLMHQMANYGPLLGQLNHFRLVLAPGTHPYAEARYAAAAGKLYRLLDDRLATREWIAGGDYSIADMAMQPWANYLEGHGFDSAAHPHLVRWRAAVASRPAVARALLRADEGFTKPAELTRKAATGEDLDKFFGRTEQVPPADFSAVVKM